VKNGEHLRMTAVSSEAIDTRVKPAYDDCKQKWPGFLPAIFMLRTLTSAAEQYPAAGAAARRR
jgi:hypothetical protein